MSPEEAEYQLDFCPACGGKLETSPVTGHRACFTHGEFVVTEDKKNASGVKVVFDMSSMEYFGLYKGGSW